MECPWHRELDHPQELVNIFMTRVLITFGDSWPGNAENGQSRGYGQILTDTYGFDRFYNYGTGGASNEDMLWQFQRHLREAHQPDHKVTAIFFLTNPSRTAQWPKHLEAPMTESVLKQLWLHVMDPTLEQMRTTSSISALQFWCQQFDFDDWYFAGWNRYNNWLPGVNLDKIWAQGKETAADWFGATKHCGEHLLDVGDNPYIKPNFCHPNPLGHQLIADRLAPWMGLAGK